MKRSDPGLFALQFCAFSADGLNFPSDDVDVRKSAILLSFSSFLLFGKGGIGIENVASESDSDDDSLSEVPILNNVKEFQADRTENTCLIREDLEARIVENRTD